MTRTDHFSCPTPSFPVYSVAFRSDRDVILGGGGGASRSGVKNKLKLARIDPKARTLSILDEHELATGEDVPASAAYDPKSKQVVAGINAAPEQLAQGLNPNCRVFDVTDDDKLSHVKSQNTVVAPYHVNEDHPFQKPTAFSRDGSLLGVGTSHNHLSILSYPSLDPAFQPTAYLDVRPGDLYDLDFSDSGTLAVATTSTTLHIYSIPTPSEKGKSTSPPALTTVNTIGRSSIKISPDLTFRAARFGRGPTSTKLFAVLNAPVPKKKGEARKSYICSWDASETKDGWKLTRCKVLASKPVTVFDISDSGVLLAYGCSDLSVGIINSSTFAPLLKILRSHELPPTALKFNPSADLLLSASVDNTVRVIVVPSDFSATLSTPVALLFVALFLAFLAVLLQARHSGAF